MGLLRILLALAVVMVHTSPLVFLPQIGGDSAVSVFFVISGFYMSLVLRGKYNPDAKGRIAFWKSRILRLYPAYALVIVVSMAGLIVTGRSQHELAYFRELSPLSLLGAVTSNVIIFGQDLINFCGISPHGDLYFARDYHLTPNPAYRLLLNPPAWSLSLELTFYVIAPFIVTRTWRVVAVVFSLALLFRLATQAATGLYFDPWSYRFFPFELNLFLAGALAHQAYEAIQKRGKPKWEVGYLCYFVVIGACFATALAHLPAEVSGLAFAVLLPFLFSASKSLKFDRWIGELSYPIYICHYHVVGLFHGKPWTFKILCLYWVAVGFTSVFILMCVDGPVDKLRHRLTARRTGQSEVTAVTESSTLVGE